MAHLPTTHTFVQAYRYIAQKAQLVRKVRARAYRRVRKVLRSRRATRNGHKRDMLASTLMKNTHTITLYQLPTMSSHGVTWPSP